MAAQAARVAIPIREIRFQYALTGPADPLQKSR